MKVTDAEARSRAIKAINDVFNSMMVKTHLLCYGSLAETYPILIPYLEHMSGLTAVSLNITEGAVRDLFITEDGVSFSARFNGTAIDIFIPLDKILQVYSPHTASFILAFNPMDVPKTTKTPPSAEVRPIRKNSGLTIVK